MTNENFGFLAPDPDHSEDGAMHHSIKIINKRLIDLELSIQELANELGCKREELSMCINHIRPYYELRRKVAFKLAISYERLWGKPAARRQSNQTQPLRRAA